MRTISKENYRVVYDSAKGESMSMVAVYRKEPGRHVIPNQQGNGRNDGRGHSKGICSKNY